MAVPTSLFISVYVGCLVSASRILHGPARAAAVPSAVAVIVVLAFCGWALLVPLAVAVVALVASTWPGGTAAEVVPLRAAAPSQSRAA